MGADVAFLDLKKTFLQIHVEKALWPYQTVRYKGKRFALTRLGFGLSVAPSVMQTVLDAAMSQDSRVAADVSTYVDDILVDKAKLPAPEVAEHLPAYGLESKTTERAKDGTRILGLRVGGGGANWRSEMEHRQSDQGRKGALDETGSILHLRATDQPPSGVRQAPPSRLVRQADGQ